MARAGLGPAAHPSERRADTTPPRPAPLSDTPSQITSDQTRLDQGERLERGERGKEGGGRLRRSDANNF